MQNIEITVRVGSHMLSHGRARGEGGAEDIATSVSTETCIWLLISRQSSNCKYKAGGDNIVTTHYTIY